MKRIKEDFILSEMANLSSYDTNLPMNIYISDSTGIKHEPRIKVQINHSQKFRKDLLVSVTISKDPEVIGEGLSIEDFKEVKKFIINNYSILLSYWNKQISIGILLKNLKEN